MNDKIINDAFMGRLEAITFNMKTAMRGYFGGTHRTKSYGSTVEFADYRDYILGDDLRRIDWNLYSRFEKFFIKLFTDERQMHVQIFLDCSKSVAYKNSPKQAFSLQMAAALGYLAVQNMDKVSIKLIHDDRADDPWGVLSGKAAYLSAISQLENVEFRGTAQIDKAITNNINPGYSDGMTVIISDFLSESNWKTAVDFLLYRHREVMLVQTLDPEEMDPPYKGRTILKDVEASDTFDLRNLKLNITRGEYDAYQKALKAHFADMKEFSVKRGVNYLFVRTDQQLEKVFLEQLYATGVIK